MTKTECAQLLTIASLIDHRVVTPDTVEAWHEIVGDVDYEAAREAMVLARRDPKVKYLEPRHIHEQLFRVWLQRGEDVSAAMARGLVPWSWPEWLPLPVDVRADLTAAREAEKQAAESQELEALRVELADLSMSELIKSLPLPTLKGLD